MWQLLCKVIFFKVTSLHNRMSYILIFVVLWLISFTLKYNKRLYISYWLHEKTWIFLLMKPILKSYMERFSKWLMMLWPAQSTYINNDDCVVDRTLYKKKVIKIQYDIIRKKINPTNSFSRENIFYKYLICSLYLFNKVKVTFKFILLRKYIIYFRIFEYIKYILSIYNNFVGFLIILCLNSLIL